MNIGLPEDDNIGFQMAPMIDIVFLLIIFFMVSAQQTTAQFKKIEVPLASKAEVPRDRTGRGTITLAGNGELYIGANPATIEEVRQMSAREIAADPAFKIYLRADKNVEHRRVREAMKACADGGVIDIVFSAHQSDS